MGNAPNAAPGAVAAGPLYGSYSLRPIRCPSRKPVHCRSASASFCRSLWHCGQRLAEAIVSSPADARQPQATEKRLRQPHLVHTEGCLPGN
jgi:hypothetical protein